MCAKLCLTLFSKGVNFLLGDKKWLHQNAKLLHLNAQNAKRETIQLRRTPLQIQKELKLKSIVQDAIKEQNTKKQNKFGDCYG